MILKDIDILNFKNIRSATLELSPGVNCLLGMNGMGKSNLLDAVHLLCMSKPMNPLPDSALVCHGEDMFLVKGTFESPGGTSDTISCGFSRGKGKSLKRNGKEYRRISEHIGRFPVVCVTPGDSMIVAGAAEERRRLMDSVISQAHPDYLATLIRYNHALESRNRLLREHIGDPLLYESVEMVLTECAALIHRFRKEWTESIAPEVAGRYSRIAGDHEQVSLSLHTRLDEAPLQELLDASRAKDLVLGHTSVGPHRDDLDITLSGYSMRRLGSQGQLKSLTVALRLAVFTYLRSASGQTPLLLLDDIFDKLDSRRVENIMHEVTTPGSFGQIFITDTNRKHLDDILAGMEGARSLISVEEGSFYPINLG